MAEYIYPAQEPADILAVIPCLNEELHLERVVRSLIRGTENLAVRIVLADGGSTDRTPEIARNLAAQYPNVFFLHNPKRIQGAAVNLAVETFGDGARLLIRLDAHAEYPPGYCEVLVAEQETTGADAVVVSMQTFGKNRFQRAVAVAQNSKLGNGGSAHRNTGAEGQWVDHGHHALMRIKAFLAVGGYDVTFSHNEDAELDIRLKQAGYRIWLTGKTSLVYYPRSKPLPLFRQYLNFGRGRARTLIKHRAFPKLRQLVPIGVVPAALLALATPVTWLAAIPFAIWMAFCLGYGLVLSARERDLPAALAGPAAMLMHLGWSLGFGIGVFSTLRRAS